MRLFSNDVHFGRQEKSEPYFDRQVVWGGQVLIDITNKRPQKYSAHCHFMTSPFSVVKLLFHYLNFNFSSFHSFLHFKIAKEMKKYKKIFQPWHKKYPFYIRIHYKLQLIQSIHSFALFIILQFIRKKSLVI